jgi:hypothetical protein
VQVRKAQPTLADAIDRLEADGSLKPTRRREMISALNRLARIIGADAAAIPADPRFLKKRMSNVAPAVQGISSANWINLRSLVSAALFHLGLIARYLGAILRRSQRSGRDCGMRCHPARNCVGGYLDCCTISQPMELFPRR